MITSISKFTRHNLLLLFILLFSSNAASAQILRVLSSDNKEPLPYATVISSNPNAMAITNMRGEGDINPMAGSGEIEIRLIGYKPILTSFSELETNHFIVFLEKSNITLRGVNISGTRWRQPTGFNPERISTVPLKEIELQNPQTAADLLGVTGEVYIQKSQLGGGSPMIRGFATKRLLYVVDGVRMNTAIFRAGNLQNVISLDGFAIENTEILFGPGSVMYGSDAIGAVMNFQTISPQFSLTNEVLTTGLAVMRYATASNEKTAHFNVNIGWKRWAMVTSFTSSDFDDLIMGSHGSDFYLKNFYVMRIDTQDVTIANPNPKKQISTGYSQINLMQKFSFKHNEHWELDYGFHYSETSDVPRYDRLVRVSKGKPKSAEWYYGPQKWIMNNFSVSYQKSNALFDKFNLRVAYQFFEESRINRNFNNPDKFFNVEDVNALSFNLNLAKELKSHSRLFYGLEFVNNQVTSTGKQKNIITGVSSPAGPRYPGLGNWTSYAAYATFQRDITTQLLAQAGVRYNGYHLNADFSTNQEFYPLPFSETSIDNAALTGSLGMVYKPDESWELRLNASTGFRAPNIDDIGKVFESEPGSVVVPNPNLKAEYAYNGEIGVAKVFGESVKIDITGYYTLLENAMTRRDFSLNGMDSLFYDGEMSNIQAITNAAAARTYGIQAGLEIKLPLGFSITSRLNFQKGEEETDDGEISPSRHAAPMFGLSRLNFESGKLTLQFYTTYAAAVMPGDMPLSERNKTDVYLSHSSGKLYAPGWYTANLKVMYHLNSTFTVTAGLENITDRRYTPYASGLVAPGRNMILSLKAGF